MPYWVRKNMKRNWQTLALLGAIAIGVALPRLSGLAFLVRPLMMTMLFLAFLRLRLENVRFRRSHFLLLLASFAVAALSFLCLEPFDAELALAAFLIALTPTGTASPVMTGMIGGDPAYPAIMVLLTSLVQPVVISAVLPFLQAGRGIHGVADLIVPLVSTILIPFAAAAAVRLLLPAVKEGLGKHPLLSFGFWIVALVIVSATASDFILRSNAPALRIVEVGLLSFALCAVQFSLGRLIGGAKHRIEASQALGQKNTVFTIWVALNFINPFVALGPASYILWHNLWNARQIHKRSKELGAQEPA